ncbi:PREDICTED: uncharacterized protein LOC108783016 isoform X2 [Cyphomyrmex costatus]|uniref:uncharacterized protein LOC108783016 isoform X2 n=1 Tax=Cyphomyrmex costatus TaxID=456900 RepID=UPI0008523F34|nr:PREDICTED: uncharacterized protein LOC108783016 isoform X2 [Cyphomyrmex costatus]
MPFYQYNSFTGKLKPSTNFQPLYPIKSEPVVIYDSIKTKPVTITPKAGYCTDKPPTLNPKLWAKYKHYGEALQKDIPVYIAGGKSDKIIFGLVCATVGICTLNSFYVIIREAFFKD